MRKNIFTHHSETRLAEKAVHCLCQCHCGTLKDLGLELTSFTSSKASLICYALPGLWGFSGLPPLGWVPAVLRLSFVSNGLSGRILWVYVRHPSRVCLPEAIYRGTVNIWESGHWSILPGRVPFWILVEYSIRGLSWLTSRFQHTRHSCCAFDKWPLFHTQSFLSDHNRKFCSHRERQFAFQAIERHSCFLILREV